MTVSRSLRILAAAATLLLLPLTAAADRSHPGYVDISRLTHFADAEAVVDVKLDGWLLGLARQAAEESGDDDARILTNIDSIRVRVFETDGRDHELRDTADDLLRDLRRAGWEEFTTVRSDDGYVFVMVIGDEAQLDGMTVVAIDDGHEAVFVNIAGAILARDIGRLLANSDIMHGDLDLDW
ncbi:MAG: DUF4252 domain-containing protein [Pseudomonadota bacterium]